MLLLPLGSSLALSLSSGLPAQTKPTSFNRRSAFAHLATVPAAALLISSDPALASIVDPEPRAITTVIIDSAQSRAGVELYDVTIGTPPKSYPAVRSLNPAGAAFSANVQPGMILLGNFPDGSKSVVGRIKNGPYPIVLQFYNLAAGGDAIGDLGRPIVSSQDALDMAQQASRENAAAKANEPQLGSKGAGLGVKTTRKATGKCETKSRRGDVLEINYEARVASPGGPLYDSSAQRGTGQPYQFILGNGDVIKGVDIALYDMCPGEIRELDIPSLLAYGRNGSRLFDIPGDVRLWWKVELVRVNFIGEENNTKRREDLYDGGSGELPVNL